MILFIPIIYKQSYFGVKVTKNIAHSDNNLKILQNLTVILIQLGEIYRKFAAESIQLNKLRNVY